MPYTEFTLDSAQATLGVTLHMGDLFPNLQPLVVSAWLTDTLRRGRRLALMSEKARSEFIVAPILLEVREAVNEAISILSGQRLDVDPERKLVGECDFLLTRSEPIPLLQAPIMAIVEAKKNDIDASLGQCVAQMVASRVFNERAGQPTPSVYGCVTTGQVWQFLGLRDDRLTLHQPQLYAAEIGLILAAFLRAVTA